MRPLRRVLGSSWDLLAYLLVLVLILAFAASRGERFDAPAAAPPPFSREEGRVLRPVSRFAPERAVKMSGDMAGPRSGTAFSVDPSGVWITARHVVEGCGRIAVLEGPGRGAEARLAGSAGPGSDVAVVLTRGGAKGLPLSEPRALRIGERGFHPGYPGGEPGEATSRLLGRQVLEIGPKGRADRSGARREEVLSWAEAGRSGGPGARIAGLSGAPVLDAHGEVVGVTLAAAPRRGRLYSAPLEEIRAALRAAGAPSAGGAGLGISARTYARRSDDLRYALSVAEIVCLG